MAIYKCKDKRFDCRQIWSRWSPYLIQIDFNVYFSAPRTGQNLLFMLTTILLDYFIYLPSLSPRFIFNLFLSFPTNPWLIYIVLIRLMEQFNIVIDIW